MYKWFLVALLPALFAARSLFTPGFIPTHDGEYHLIRFYEFAKMLSAGSIFPRWAPTLNSGYGVPLFNFHYPFPNYLGTLYHFLGVSFPDAVKLVLAAGYLAAVAFCFLWLSKLFDKKSAATGTIVFSFVPYWFVDIYVRGVIGEVLGLAWVMLAFASIERGWKTIAACAIGLLIISHNIMALLFLPILLVYIIFRNRTLIVPYVLGIGLTAYFWIPAILERSYVSGLNSVNFSDHFPAFFQLLVPSWGTGFSQPGTSFDEISFQIGMVPLFVFVIACIIFLRKNNNTLAVFFFTLCIASFFLMQQGSMVIWQNFPMFSYVQYPWRLLSLFIPASGFLAAYITSLIKNKLFPFFLTIAAVVLAYSYTIPVVYEPRSDAYYLSRPNFTDGTSSLGNSFSTVWSPWKTTRASNKIDVVSGVAVATQKTIDPLKYLFTLDAGSESTIRVNTLYYPGWEVLVNNKKVNINYQQDGTITFFVPSGLSQVLVRFTETPLRAPADLLSVFSLFCIIVSFILEFNAYRHKHNAAFKRE